uniref:sodium-dependent serotonin transporter-like isoform X1 n=1 Tax=Styela clava TaxID=7725 RepID=UPI00193947A1|nr:sodium-dependent serotonin transporter-like isoform X1 [Styela clava]
MSGNVNEHYEGDETCSGRIWDVSFVTEQSGRSLFDTDLASDFTIAKMSGCDITNEISKPSETADNQLLEDCDGIIVRANWTENLQTKNDGTVQSRDSITNRRLSDEMSVRRSSSSYGLVLVQRTSREKWSRKIDFLLSVVGFAVDLGNVWRFPYICYKNGGGAFLIPYLLMIMLGGVPLFYLELALGQYHRNGCISIWRRICPILKGLGYAICLMALYVSSYYNTVIAWAVFYLYSSFTSELPWSHCGHEWNDNTTCVDKIDAAAHNQSWSNTSQSPSQQFFERHVLELHKSTGLDDLGAPKMEIVFCLLIVYVIVYFSLWKGVKSSGKVVWFTATFPYVVLLILLVRGATLPGASKGIEFYLKPNWETLADPVVWLQAATQVFFSLGPGFGTLLALSSYNDFHNNCYRDALITSTINCLTSFLAGFVVFSVLGYMAHLLNKEDISDVTTPGVGLLFVVFSQALTQFSGSVFFSIMFFLMIITLGLDSTFGGLEAVITGFSDEFPKTIGKHRELFVLGLLVASFTLSLSTTTYGGIYMVTLMETYATGTAIMIVVLLEAIAVSWFYGIDRVSHDIRAMIGSPPGMYWKICWKYVSPVFLSFMIIMSFIFIPPLEYGSYEFPNWSTGVGWAITVSSVILVPTYAIYRSVKKCYTKRRISQKQKNIEDKISHESDCL